MTGLFLFFFMCSSVSATTLPEVMAPVTQFIFVLSKGNDSPNAEIQRYERGDKGWNMVGSSFRGVLGKNGIATGDGVYAGPEFQAEKVKAEGDRRTPTGIFRLRKVYGIGETDAFKGRMPYVKVTAELEGVDDPKSRYYNQIVDRSRLKETPDWQSHETMLRKDGIYHWLVEVAHNPLNIPGRGSLIFFHIWRAAGKGTIGCVAAEESKLLEMLRWLDPVREPRLIILPSQNLAIFQKALGITGNFH